MQNFLEIKLNEASNITLEQIKLDQVQTLIKSAAIKLVVKMHLSDPCIKEIGEL